MSQLSEDRHWNCFFPAVSYLSIDCINFAVQSKNGQIYIVIYVALCKEEVGDQY